MNEIQEIEAELQLINERYLRNKEEHERRCKKFRAKQKSLRKRGCALLATHHRLRLIAVLAQPGAVRLRCSYSGKSPCRHLNDKVGTLTEVKRTRCRVDFDSESWTLPTDYLVPVNSEETEGNIVARLRGAIGLH